MSGIAADYTHYTFSAYNFTFLAHFFYRTSYFHCQYSFIYTDIQCDLVSGRTARAPPSLYLPAECVCNASAFSLRYEPALSFHYPVLHETSHLVMSQLLCLLFLWLFLLPYNNTDKRSSRLFVDCSFTLPSPLSKEFHKLIVYILFST